MKKQLLVQLVTAIFVSSCSTLQSDNIKTFIPGVYVKEINQEFAKGMDTILISVLDASNNKFKVINNSSYQQSIDGKLQPLKNENHVYMAAYDDKSKELHILNKERTFTFYPDQNKMQMGKSEYNKITKN
ncbi:MAG: hypothetical protein V4717_14470 [Bacteroidota bacterium]